MSIYSFLYKRYPKVLSDTVIEPARPAGRTMSIRV